MELTAGRGLVLGRRGVTLRRGRSARLRTAPLRSVPPRASRSRGPLRGRAVPRPPGRSARSAVAPPRALHDCAAPRPRGRPAPRPSLPRPRPSVPRPRPPAPPPPSGHGPGNPPISSRAGVYARGHERRRCRLGITGSARSPEARIASAEACCGGQFPQQEASQAGAARAAFPPEHRSSTMTRARAGRPTANRSGLRGSMPEGGGSFPWRNPRPVRARVQARVRVTARLSRSHTFMCTRSTPCWTGPPASRSCSRRPARRA